MLLEMHPSRWWYFFGPAVTFPFLVFFDYLILTRVDTALPQVPVLSGKLAALPGVSGYSATFFLGVVAVVLTAVWAGWEVKRFYDWASQTYAVTEDRIIQQNGIIRHVIQEIPIRQIRDIDVFQKSFRARILRYGNLRFKSLSEVEPAGAVSKFPELEHILDPRHPLAKQSGVEWWVGVPNPFLIERTVENMTRAAFAATPQQLQSP